MKYSLWLLFYILFGNILCVFIEPCVVFMLTGGDERWCLFASPSRILQISQSANHGNPWPGCCPQVGSGPLLNEDACRNARWSSGGSQNTGIIEKKPQIFILIMLYSRPGLSSLRGPISFWKGHFHWEIFRPMGKFWRGTKAGNRGHGLRIVLGLVLLPSLPWVMYQDS